jgi:hypothetical protein
MGASPNVRLVGMTLPKMMLACAASRLVLRQTELLKIFVSAQARFRVCGIERRAFLDGNIVERMCREET